MQTLSSADHRNISAWAIHNPVATAVLFLLLTVGGLFAFPGLRINNTPDIDLPAVVVTVAQPGAAPSELETQVTRRVEDAIAGLGEVKHMTSTVVDGASTTVIEFELGKDIDRATNDVRNKVAQIRSDLPAGIREPVVTRIEATGGAILTYTVPRRGCPTSNCLVRGRHGGQGAAVRVRRRAGEPGGRRGPRGPRGAQARPAARARASPPTK
jgi:multidrug efflux pump subunit AcrB